MIIALLIVLGLILGSFVNALVWRLRQQDELLYPELLVDNTHSAVISTPSTSLRAGSAEGVAERSRSKGAGGISRQARNDSLKDYSILRGRSMCPDCHHELAARDLVPVFSWLWLRGKCRYCHKPISWQYPLVEIMTAVVFVISYRYWPGSLEGIDIAYFGFWLLAMVAFVALAVYDLHWYELPDRIVWPLVGLAAVWVGVRALTEGSTGVLLGAVLGVAVIAGLFGAIYAVSKGEWIGFGDVKLAIALGLLVGSPLLAALVIFFASVIGTLATLPMMLRRKPGVMTRHIPFGPPLLLASFIVYLWGAAAVQWYIGLL